MLIAQKEQQRNCPEIVFIISMFTTNKNFNFKVYCGPILCRISSSLKNLQSQFNSSPPLNATHAAARRPHSMLQIKL